MATSTDGTTWTSHSLADTDQWKSVVHGDGIFVGVRDLGNSRLTSSGTWTAPTTTVATTAAPTTVAPTTAAPNTSVAPGSATGRGSGSTTTAAPSALPETGSGASNSTGTTALVFLTAGVGLVIALRRRGTI